jgi:hypothetical protein
MKNKLKFNMTTKIILIIVLFLAVAFIYKMNPDKDSSLGVVNQITMNVINVDENVNVEYATIWLTPSSRIYKLPKNIPEYDAYISLMKQSKNDGSLLNFTIAADDVIKSVNKYS